MQVYADNLVSISTVVDIGDEDEFYYAYEEVSALLSVPRRVMVRVGVRQHFRSNGFTHTWLGAVTTLTQNSETSYQHVGRSVRFATTYYQVLNTLVPLRQYHVLLYCCTMYLYLVDVMSPFPAFLRYSVVCHGITWYFMIVICYVWYRSRSYELSFSLVDVNGSTSLPVIVQAQREYLTLSYLTLPYLTLPHYLGWRRRQKKKDRKKELREMIEGAGGEYMGAMEARTTTHLIAEVGICMHVQQ